MLNVRTEFRKGIFFVRLRGHLNKDTIGKLNNKVTNVIKKNKIYNVVFNFSNLKSIDIKGIHTIFYNYEICKSNDGISFLCGNNDNIKNKLKKSRLINYVYEIPDELSAFNLINIGGNI